MGYKYAFNQYNQELMARAVGNSLPISVKESAEICTFIRHKPVERAKKMLNDVIDEKMAVPYRRFNMHVAHKTKIGPGRYPKSASTEILSVIKSAEANAQFKGLNPGNMVIRHICAHKASTPYHFGRHRGRKMKRTHIEVVLEETKKKDTKETKSKEKHVKSDIKNQEQKQEQKMHNSNLKNDNLKPKTSATAAVKHDHN
ncbi:50S ribosomal protein L22 [Candidatus Woesearchaeota archaeon]|nr:50S ribosomal protein L22P [uncultured archaeon]MBS3122735.1 50S ribosomal protein L22 [Candidatus Woesearchaeota archaeon]